MNGFAVLALALLTATQLAAQEVGDRIQITGCEDGELMVSIVNLWEGPSLSRVIGRVSGTSISDRCHGSVVIIRDTTQHQFRKLYKIETVIGSQEGWLTEVFIGQAFDVATCAEFFRGEDVSVIRKCREG
jgi:hypothetical protein